MAVTEDDLGTKKISYLLIRQAVPASVGILFMTVNILIDTIFVGRWIGSQAIAALTVVMPIVFLIAAVGLSIGVGGSSVVSRALGAKEVKTASKGFAHQIMLTFWVSAVFVAAGLLFTEPLLAAFGAHGQLMAPAKLFFFPLLLAAPLQAFCSMSNSVIRAEDRAGFAMAATIIASVSNIILDILFIKVFDMGITGAALATAASFVLSFLFVIWYFIYRSSIRLALTDFRPDLGLAGEISALSFTTFARQGVIGLLSILLNNTLYEKGGEHSVAVYGIISRMLMFALFPVTGITEGFLPVAGYNYGANKFHRVRHSVRTAIKYAGGFAICIYVLIFIFAESIVGLFSEDPAVLRDTPNALRWVFGASPVIAIQLIGAAYFQAAGKAAKALMLTLSKQGFFLIPLLLILPRFFGIFGVWVSFPIADILATLVTGIFLRKEWPKIK